MSNKRLLIEVTAKDMKNLRALLTKDKKDSNETIVAFQLHRTINRRNCGITVLSTKATKINDGRKTKKGVTP